MKETVIKIWVDESTEIDGNYMLVGYLITDAYENECHFFRELTEARIKNKCFTTLHGNRISEKDREFKLFDDWLNIFNKYNQGVYFHVFLYKRDEKMISKGKTFEHYFAKQSVFSLSQKMKGNDLFDKHVANMFKNVSTIFVLFDNRGDHFAKIISKNCGNKDISRISKLEEIYSTEITKQIEKETGKSSKTKDLTVRFSFVSDECFDGIQFTDCLLYAVRQKIGEKNSNHFVKVFDKYFLEPLDKNVQSIGFQEIYKWDKKFNFFKAYEK